MHTYTRSHTPSTRIRSTGWRIHGGVEDTKFSTFACPLWTHHVTLGHLTTATAAGLRRASRRSQASLHLSRRSSRGRQLVTLGSNFGCKRPIEVIGNVHLTCTYPMAACYMQKRTGLKLTRPHGEVFGRYQNQFDAWKQAKNDAELLREATREREARAMTASMSRKRKFGEAVLRAHNRRPSCCKVFEPPLMYPHARACKRTLALLCKH